jgi:putative nucleotidyltransferase with HDIG domain
VQLSEILSALTFALDLTEAAVPGHALRSCLLGMRLGDAVGLSAADRTSLYYALLLKDVGCSITASRVTALFGGSDLNLKRAARLRDWNRPNRPSPRVLRWIWRETLPGHPLSHRLKHLLAISRQNDSNSRELLALRCERGAEIVTRLEMGPAVAEAVRHLDEHWNGSGHPSALSGADIPLFSRICLVALNLDVYAAADGPARSLDVLRSRSGTWFDPDLVRAAVSLHHSGELWQDCLPTDDPERTRAAVLDLDPGLRYRITDQRLDLICEVFASVVDAKSPFTFRHSMGVMSVAQAIAQAMGLPAATSATIRRAALLHDLGKLGVPNSILDKQGALSATEWKIIRNHPALSGSILNRVPSLAELARLTQEHHERLDGTGYPHGLSGAALSQASRLISLADNYAAMAEDRPYREGMGSGEVLSILAAEAGPKLDGDCFDALIEAARSWSSALPIMPSGSMLPADSMLPDSGDPALA